MVFIFVHFKFLFFTTSFRYKHEWCSILLRVKIVIWSLVSWLLYHSYVGKLFYGWLFSMEYRIVCIYIRMYWKWLVLNFRVLLYIRLKIAWIRYGIKTKILNKQGFETIRCMGKFEYSYTVHIFIYQVLMSYSI